jgi:hypothetical protein
VIDGATNTNCTSAGNPFTAAHVGNIINVTGGTGFTVQRVQIMSVAAGVATCDKSLGTLSSTGGTGNLGGSLLTVGTAGGLHVGGNTIWAQVGTYSSTSTSSNVANGRITLAAATLPAVTTLRGYDVTHGDETSNRPTLAWGVNAGSNYLVICGSGSVIENLIIDGRRDAYTLTRGISAVNGSAVRNVKLMRCVGFPLFISGVTLIDVMESTDNADVISVGNTSVKILKLYAHDNTGAALTTSSNFVSLLMSDSIIESNGAAGVNIALTAFTAQAKFDNCTFYGNTGAGIDITANSTHIVINNCIFEGNGNYGIDSPGRQSGVKLNNCAFYNNTSGKYNTANIATINVSGEIIPTVSPFVDAANGDFRLNMNAGGGALLRGAGYPQTLPGLTYAHRRDIGAHQHSGPSRGING